MAAGWLRRYAFAEWQSGVWRRSRQTRRMRGPTHDQSVLSANAAGATLREPHIARGESSSHGVFARAPGESLTEPAGTLGCHGEDPGHRPLT
jgi:hypothetical protein